MNINSLSIKKVNLVILLLLLIVVTFIKKIYKYNNKDFLEIVH